MFSGSIFVVLLVVFVPKGQAATTVAPSSASSIVTKVSSASPETPTGLIGATTVTAPAFQTQGQNITTVIPSATSSVVSQNSSVTIPPPTSTAITTPTTTPTATPLIIKTCAKLNVTIEKPWDEDYGNKLSETYKDTSKNFSSALEELYNTEHKDVKVSDVTFNNKMGKVFAGAKLCLVFTIKEKVLIKDVFFEEVKTGKLGKNLTVIKDSAEFEALEVEYKNYKVKEGECDKCDGAAGPFDIEGECVPDSEEFSCNGLEEKKTKKTEDCTAYCSSTALTVSTLVLAIGILLSSSLQ